MTDGIDESSLLTPPHKRAPRGVFVLESPQTNTHGDKYGSKSRVNLSGVEQRGKINHKLDLHDTRYMKNPFLWIIAPSAPMLLAHQLGTLKPSYGFSLCSKILEVMRNDQYIHSPINTTLKNARLEIFALPDRNTFLQYHPAHALLYNSDSLEEGSRQLVANYFYYVYSQVGYYGKLATKLFSVFLTIDSYIDFLEDSFKKKSEISKDSWDTDFTVFSQTTQHVISSNYIAPDEWHLDSRMTQSQIEIWVNEQIKIQKEEFPKIENKFQELCTKRGII